ncbi:tRNA(m5U54)methyltransferase [Lecanora helva]
MTHKEYRKNQSQKRQRTVSRSFKEGSNEEVLLLDVKSLLQKQKGSVLSNDSGPESKEASSSDPSHNLPERFSEIEVEILELSSSGDGLGVSSTSDHVYVVPFAVPGDVVQAKAVHHFPKDQYTLTDFIKVIKPAPRRDDSLIKCPYFAKCAGCQIQMLPYDLQLEHKKSIVEKAFHNFSSLTPEAVPAVGDTIGSPMRYGYRTKLTPHFDGPPGSMSRKAKRDLSLRKGFTEVPPIGFMLKGTRKTIDIEDCPIGTDAVRKGLQLERKKIAKEIAQYKKGATILLRETTSRKPKATAHEKAPPSDLAVKFDDNATKDGELPLDGPATIDEPAVSKSPDALDLPYTEEKSYITDQRATSREYIDDFELTNTAGAFFQNNNSILPRFIAYIREHIFPASNVDEPIPIKYLIDAYCGSGLFTVTLASLFSSSTGIDIAETSVASARKNATINKIPNASFMQADARKLFQEITYPADKTVVIIDPPRKGCDEAFLQQLLNFGPRRVVYVSCNVHTQARDVGILVEGRGSSKYRIESLQGFDFFPQTGHVEGVAVLARSP